MDKSRAPTTATSSYAPRSPDLSALSTTSYIPDPQTIPPHQSIYSNNSNQYTHNREAFSLPQPSHTSAGYLAPPPQADDSFGAQVYGAPPPPQSIYMQQHEMQQNPYMTMPPQPQTSAPGPSSSRPRRGMKQDPGEAEWLPSSSNQFSHFDQFQNTPPQSQLPMKSEHSLIKPEENETRKPAPGELEGTNVKTKFPVARIKRIVQADEDVGKVAQVTPVVVSKALELFMISVALKSAEEARRRQSKRVTGQHLKAIVQADDQFDFLSEIIGKIPDAPASKDSSKKGAKNEESEEDDALDDEFEPTPSTAKRKGKAAASSGAGTRTRRKKESP